MEPPASESQSPADINFLTDADQCISHARLCSVPCWARGDDGSLETILGTIDIPSEERQEEAYIDYRAGTAQGLVISAWRREVHKEGMDQNLRGGVSVFWGEYRHPG